MRMVTFGGVILLLSSSCGGSPLAPSNAQFVGLWQNVSPQTANVAQINIATQGSALSVHAFGNCVPTLCDWGEVSASATSETLQAVFTLGIEVDTLTLTLLNGQLQLAGHTHYTDNSGRADHDFTDVFNKGS